MRAPNGDKVGEVYARVRLSNAGDFERARLGQLPPEDVRSVEVEALVDTGSTRSAVPKEIAERLGLNILSHAMGRLADGTRVSVGICSPIAFEILGRETLEGAYVMGDEVLIGQTALETTDLLVDCANRRLIPKHPEGPVFRL
jgi:clan AA aspartic protease